MEIQKVINMKSDEYSNLCSFLEWKINNPEPCNNCPHFATWQMSACCGCPEQSAWVNTYKSMPGYELSKNEELKEFCEAFTRFKKAQMAFVAAKNAWEDARKEFHAAGEAFDKENDHIVIFSVKNETTVEDCRLG